MSLINENYLFASLIWSSIGFGYCIYAKRQRSWVPMVGGVLMITQSSNAVFGIVIVLAILGLCLLAYFFGLSQGRRQVKRDAVLFNVANSVGLHRLAEAGDLDALKRKLSFLVYAW